MALKYLLIKEIKQFKNNKFLIQLVIIFPLTLMLIFPWIITFNIKDVNITVIDHDHSSTSTKLIKDINSSNYFTIHSVKNTYNDALVEIEKDHVDLILEIPSGFEKNIINGNPTELYIAAKAVNSMKSGLGSGYLNSIINDFNKDRPCSVPTINNIQTIGGISAEIQYRYNRHLDYKPFMVPALMTLIIILLCGFLPTLNIVNEKETGTIEQINVTPVKKIEFIASKMIFYCVLGLTIFILSFIIGKLVYGIAPYGGTLVLIVAALLFIIVMSSIGLIVSNYSNTLQQAIFSIFFLSMFFIMMCGIFTPVESMEPWAQAITYALPPRYFVDIMRNVCLKGSIFTDLKLDFIMLAVFAVTINVFAVLSYKKRQ